MVEEPTFENLVWVANLLCSMLSHTLKEGKYVEAFQICDGLYRILDIITDMIEEEKGEVRE